ncbi:F-box/LRR-repeat protein [Striga hermonthica]|uniref:F-box/LRR-repeat protein n=1 Tax=Striga hermonthica TaxID=68872 RepID=A0A9N7ME52_STRHE|nr:F-box/LRR-repeat protein [Striga hermonthica]
MDTLTLDCINSNEYQLETLIRAVIDRGIRNLYLELDFDTYPRYIFNCKTIVDLKIHFYRALLSLSAVENVSLPSLKKFHGFYVVWENDEALSLFLSGCPSLEELNISLTSVKGNDYVGCITISSPTIKMFKLDLNNLTCDPKCRMILNAPALRYLQVDGYQLGSITVPITMVSLVKAELRLRSYNTAIVNFLQCYVKYLVISGWMLEEVCFDSSIS